MVAHNILLLQCVSCMRRWLSIHVPRGQAPHNSEVHRSLQNFGT